MMIEELLMKRTIPLLSPIGFGLFGGLLVACGLSALSMMTSPFADLEKTSFLIFSFFISMISALLIIVMIAVNIVYLINLENRRKAKITILLEILSGVVLLFVSWNLLDPMVSELYHLF